MEANPVRVVQYFDGEKQSIIPLFQRHYVWVKKNWEALWDDVMSYYTAWRDGGSMGASHFMGAIVSIPAKTLPVGVTKHLIIDGQQRLTTVAILLCALRDSYERRAAQLQDYLVNRHYEDSDDYLKLLPTQGDRDSYLSVVNKKSELPTEKHPIRECYNYFTKILKIKDDDGHDIDYERILEIIKTRFQVVMINLGEADDPYLIFESLNYKGEPLSQSDLVRNYVLMRFRHSEQERIYREIWHPMEDALGPEMLENFLWHYTIKSGDGFKKSKQLYTAIKSELGRLKEPNEVEYRVNEMRNSALNYRKFLYPDEETNLNIRKQLIILEKLEATIAYPILINLFASRDKGQFGNDVLLECLLHINSFIVRRAVCDEKRSALNKLFVSIASKIPTNSGDTGNWIANELIRRVRSERWPDDGEFKEAILKKLLYKTKAARILLEGIEEYLAGKEVIDLSSDKITIEHIMPQMMTPQWRDELGEDSDEVHRIYRDTLGNLTLTGFNPELSNLPFEKKKKKYCESGIAMNRELAKFEGWSQTAILERAETLANYAIKIWPRP